MAGAGLAGGGQAPLGMATRARPRRAPSLIVRRRRRVLRSHRPCAAARCLPHRTRALPRRRSARTA